MRVSDYDLLYDLPDGEYEGSGVEGVRTTTIRAGRSLEVMIAPRFRWTQEARREAKARRSTPAMKKINEEKAAVLYDYLDSQSYYSAPVEKEFRSMMNVTFVTGDPELDKKFAKEADAQGFKNIKGHRSVGGMRASIYNAMPIEGVKALVEFMDNFAKNNPKA